MHRKQKTPPKRGSKLVGERGFEPPTHWSQYYYHRSSSAGTKWRARQDSNLRPLPPEGSALSS